MSTSAARIAANKSGSLSVARSEANRANAQRSTGPRTPEGKARVSENALKHGLRSERNPLDLATDTCLPFEREEFQTTLAAFMDDLAPQGPIETRLVERLAQIDLRLNRAIRMETTNLEMNCIQTQTEATAAGSSLATDTGRTRDSWLLTMSFLRDPAALKLIGQYEARLSRDFARTLSQFRSAQRDKRTGPLAGASQGRAPLCAINEKPREQTQCDQMPIHPATADASTMPTRSLASDGHVAPTPPLQSGPTPISSRLNDNLAKQTQSAPQIIDDAKPAGNSPASTAPNQKSNVA